MSKKKYPETASPELSDIIIGTAAKRIQWREDILAGSRQTKVITANYRGWNLSIEDNFLWASAEGSLLPLGEAHELTALVKQFFMKEK